MKILDIEQGTPQWHDARRCKITGTKLKSVMGTNDARRSLIAELIAEEATEQSKIFRSTPEMERGTAEEIFAVREFEKRTGKIVGRIGMCVHPEYDFLALSPDGLIQSENGKYEEAVEVKCPDSKKSILYQIENKIPPLETGIAKLSKPTKANPEPELVISATAPFLGIPSEYKWQVVNYFLVNKDLKKLYFLVYDPRFIDEETKLYTVEVSRENELMQEAIEEAESELLRFHADWMKWKEIILPSKF